MGDVTSTATTLCSTPTLVHSTSFVSGDLCPKCNNHFSWSPSSGSTSTGSDWLPLVLPCGHSLCGNCIESTGQCPICQKTFDSTSQFPPNYHLLGRLIFHQHDEGRNLDSHIEPLESKYHEKPDLVDIKECIVYEDDPELRKLQQLEALKQLWETCNQSISDLQQADQHCRLELKAHKDLVSNFYAKCHGILTLAETEALDKLDKLCAEQSCYLDRLKVQVRLAADDIYAQDPDEKDVREFIKTCTTKTEVKFEMPDKLKVNICLPDKTTVTKTELLIDITSSGQARLVALQPAINFDNRKTQTLKLDEVEVVKVTLNSTPRMFCVQKQTDVAKVKALSDLMEKKFKDKLLVPVTSVHVGLMCVTKRKFQRFKLEDDDDLGTSWARSEVTAMDNSEIVHLTHVDFGTTQKVIMGKVGIFHCDNEWLQEPIYAIKCTLNNVRPPDSTTNWWSDTATLHFRRLVGANCFVLATATSKSNKNILTVDLHVEKSHEVHGEPPTSVADALVFNGVAEYVDVKKRKHKVVIERCKFYEVPRELLYKASSHSAIVTVTSPKHGLDMVYVIIAASGDQSFVPQLNDILSEMCEFYKRDKEHGIDFPRVGQPCAVSSSKDGYFRGRICEVQSGQPHIGQPALVQVFFVDQGITKWVNLAQVRLLPTRFMKLPGLAVPVKLSGIKPPENWNNWPKRSIEEFMAICKKKPLTLYVDQMSKVCNNQNTTMEVTLFERSRHKDVCVNALLLYKNLAQLTQPNWPCFKRVEYYKCDPLNLMTTEHRPVYTSCQVTSKVDSKAINLTHEIMVASILPPIGSALVIVAIKCNSQNGIRKHTVDKIHEDMAALYDVSKTDTTTTRVLLKQPGEGCVVMHKKKWMRARILHVDESVTRVLMIDTGELIDINSQDLCMPLYGKNFYEAESNIIAFKLDNVTLTQYGRENAVQVLRKWTCDVDCKTTFHVSKIDLSAGIDLVRLHKDALLEENLATLPKSKLIQMSQMCVGPFDSGTTVYYDLGLQLVQLGFAEYHHTRYDELDQYRRIKLNWQPPVLPTILPDDQQNNDVADIEGQVVLVGTDQTFHLETAKSLQLLLPIHEALNCLHLNSSPKPQDTYWNEGEPCAVRFAWDGKWYRGEVKQVMEEFCTVRLIDYGNIINVSIQELRKDVCGLDIPEQSTRVNLVGIDTFDAIKVNEQLVGNTVSVFLKEKPPSSWPLVGRMVTSDKTDLAVWIKNVVQEKLENIEEEDDNDMYE